jgi:Flp pilus assembly pilin Flp
MLQYLNQKRGQTTLEYAVLIVVVIGALLTIQVYIKRGVQGRLRSAADDIGEQYSDGNMNEIKTTVKNSTTEETFIAGTSSTHTVKESTNSTANSLIINTQQEYWGTQS